MVLWIKKDRGIVETINQVELFNGSDGTKGFFLCWSYKLFLSLYYSQAWAPLFYVQAAFRILFNLGIFISFPLPACLLWKNMSLWFKLMIVGHLAGLMWILHYMLWSFSFNLSLFFFDNINGMLHIVKIVLYNVLWFYHIYFPSLFSFAFLTVYATK